MKPTIHYILKAMYFKFQTKQTLATRQGRQVELHLTLLSLKNRTVQVINHDE